MSKETKKMMNKETKKIFNKNILLIVAIPFLVAIGVVAGSYFSNPETPVVTGSEKGAAESVVKLDEFLLNLKSSDNQTNYISLELSLATTQKGGEETINDNIDKVRDIIIYKVSQLSMEDIYNSESRMLKDTLKNSINEEFEQDIVSEVYITNIVLQ